MVPVVLLVGVGTIPIKTNKNNQNLIRFTVQRTYDGRVMRYIVIPYDVMSNK